MSYTSDDDEGFVASTLNAPTSKMSYAAPVVNQSGIEPMLDTLDEPVSETLKRDFKNIFNKVLLVLLPKGQKDALRDWDLWGPLIICLSLAITDSSQKSAVFSGIFVIIWAGSAVVTLNSQLLGGKLSFFQTVCVLGYCLFPLDVAALVCGFIPIFFIRLIIVLGLFGWSLVAAVRFLGDRGLEKRKILALYPIFLFYFIIGWLILVSNPIFMSGGSNSGSGSSANTTGSEIESCPINWSNIVETSLKYFQYDNAIFYAERWLAQYPTSEEALYFLGLSYFEKKEYLASYHILKSSTSFRCQFLLAKCCFFISKYQEAELLLSNILSLHTQMTAIEQSFVYSLLGDVCKAAHRIKQSIHFYEKALKLNTDLFSAIQGGASFLEENENVLDIRINKTKITQTKSTNITLREKKRNRNGESKVKETKNSSVLELNTAEVNQPQSIIAIFTKALCALSQYKTKEALQIMKKCPTPHLETPYAQIIMAKIYFEDVNYQMAEMAFKKVRLYQPYRVQDMSLYSTTLWHLKKESDLNYLSKEMLSLDQTSSEVWCVVGNSFSLQKENENALKCFQRAIQVDPKNAYAHNLAGHEYHSNGALEKALKHFRSAISEDPLLYKAWFGLGMIFYKQEKWSAAEFHFKKAMEINKSSTILSCYVGMVLHKMHRFEEALLLFDRSIQLNQNNPQVRYRKACCLMDLQRFEDSLREFKEVIRIAPKESHVYFRIGQLYHQLDDRDQALDYYLMALNLEPKSSMAIREAIEKLNHDQDPKGELLKQFRE